MWRWSGRCEALDVSLADDQVSHRAGGCCLAGWVGVDLHPGLRISRFVRPVEQANFREGPQRLAQSRRIVASDFVIDVDLGHCGSVNA